MQKPIIENKWTYEIIKNHGKGFDGYGFKLDVYKNGILVFSNGEHRAGQSQRSNIEPGKAKGRTSGHGAAKGRN